MVYKMNDRFVFQVRGVEKSNGGFQRKILSHMGMNFVSV